MSTTPPIDIDDMDDMDDRNDKVIDIGPSKRKPRRKLVWIIAAAVALIFILLRSISVYISALWFDSLGYSSVYWYIFRTKLLIFLVFAVLTII
ncbi:MAG: hypothetical protein H0X14_11905, partial [Acidobacteria bacterium]|nr:hypothetical protein [Acidobacteriota bacterium]